MLAAEGTECAGRRFRFDITAAAVALAPEPPASLQLQRRSDVVDFLEACLGDAVDTQAPANEPVVDTADVADAVAVAADAEAEEPVEDPSAPSDSLPADAADGVAPDADADETVEETAPLPAVPAAAVPELGTASARDATDAAATVPAFDCWREETRRLADRRRVLSFYLRSAATGDEVRHCSLCLASLPCCRACI
jgi:hypothetical protein